MSFEQLAFSIAQFKSLFLLRVAIVEKLDPSNARNLTLWLFRALTTHQMRSAVAQAP